MPLIPRIGERYPDIDDLSKWSFVEKRLVRVPVEKIVGLANPNVSRFYENWMPTLEGRDKRFEEVYWSMKTFGWSPKHQFVPVLWKVGDEWWVADDGTRRCAVAHMLGLKYITADVIEWHRK